MKIRGYVVAVMVVILAKIDRCDKKEQKNSEEQDGGALFNSSKRVKIRVLGPPNKLQL